MLLAGKRYVSVWRSVCVAAVAESHRGRSRGKALWVAMAGQRSAPWKSRLVPHLRRQHHRRALDYHSSPLRVSDHYCYRTCSFLYLCRITTAVINSSVPTSTMHVGVNITESMLVLRFYSIIDAR